MVVEPDPTIAVGLNVAVGPEGWGVMLNVTVRLNPPSPVIVTV
jgi:hypothetical protein